jgi:hypothetical protein
MEAELAAARLAGNRFLAGLVEQHGAEAVETAALAALNYPAAMVSTANEAMAIQSFFANLTST